MHPMAPALTAMVARTTAQARLSESAPVDPGELERCINRALGEF